MLSCRFPRWWLLSRGLVLSLILRLIFRGYEVSEVPTPYYVLYFPLELYAVVRAVPIVPMELAVPDVVSYGGV